LRRTLGTLNLPGAIRQEDSFVDKPESVAAMQTLAEAFTDQSTQPISVITPAGRTDATIAEIPEHDGSPPPSRAAVEEAGRRSPSSRSGRRSRSPRHPRSSRCESDWRSRRSAGRAPSNST
jgi:hypothetical protein